MTKKRVRIVSDGSPWNVTVTETETGQPIPHVRSVTWNAQANGMPTATIETLMAEVDITTEATIGDAAPLVKIYGELLTEEQWSRVREFIHEVASENVGAEHR